MSTVKPIISTICCLSVIAATVFTSGCGKTSRTRKVEESGFMTDYSILKKTKGDKAQLLYVNYQTDWKQYKNIYLEPITVWQTADSPLADVDKEEVDALATFFYNAVQKELAKDYKLAKAPGPNTLRIRMALTEAEKSNVPLDIITTVVPIGLGISYVKDLATGTHTFVGKMAAEIEIRDSLTNELLAAAVAARVGEKLVVGEGQLGKWGDVHEISLEWAATMRLRLSQARAGTLQKELAE